MKVKNPFLMIGSYFGLLFGLIGSYFSLAIVFYFSEIGRFNYLLLLIPLIPLVIGFLIGWLVHLMALRVLKK